MDKSEGGSQPSLLIVEDDVQVSTAIVRWFRGKDVVVKTAFTLEQAAEILELFPFDVIAWDGNVQSATPKNTAELVRKYKHRARLHIAMSDNLDGRQLLMEAGCTAQITKTKIDVIAIIFDFLGIPGTPPRG